MSFVELLKVLCIFDYLVNKLLAIVKTTRGLVLSLVFTCFFSSIFITNDIALVTFVPFTIMALKRINRTDLVVIVVTLQTIAANMGSMLLPIGSPHNIVIFALSNISFLSFVYILLPYVIVSAIFLLVVCFLLPSKHIELPHFEEIKFVKKDFFKRIFFGVDYCLLLTFVALFVLIGNLEHITWLSDAFKSIIVGNEVICGILASQIFSNVPAAMMLCGFSSNYVDIIIGINIGGLGTLIASMANLISFKIVIKEFSNLKTRFILVFSILNLVLIFILLGVYWIFF